MARSTSKLPLLAAILLAVLLLLPSAAVAKAIDATNTQHMDLPDGPVGPESVAFDKSGAGPYVSISDGRILKYGGEGAGWTTFSYSPSYAKNDCGAPSEIPQSARESSCGRPLGLRFHNNSGNLGRRCAASLHERGGCCQITGDVYFTDSSTTYTRAQHEMVTGMRDSTGRIMRYNRRTNKVTVLQSGVTYPNDIAISADRTHLIVALTGPCKLMRYWIRGPNAGTSELFTDLPGYPDNVRPDGKGGYWVALHREKNEKPNGKEDSHLVAIRIGAEGERLQEMRGPKDVRPTETVEREDGKIYLGSVELSYVSIVN
ncbi:unnamed protein product [Urochloa decumbens]|uniref:Strictosidine synthase conserved region domain-containing protein n=1 Tax=Urochloa decumbens TaxID=240449 RepID=A0ABC9BYV9_9POAL